MDKNDFRNYRPLLLEVQQLKEQLQTLEASIYSPRGQRFTTTPTAPTRDRPTMDGPVARHIRLVELYEEELAEKEAKQFAIEQAIQGLEDTAERVVMRERYIAGRGWSAVIGKMQKLGYSERQVYRLHGSALWKLKEV